MHNLKFAILVLPWLLSGCANWSSVHHTFKAGNEYPESISIDAKQRVVIATTKQTSTYNASGNKEKEAIIYRACAEPSPDAISALASSLAGNGELTSEKLQAALKLQGAISQTETSSFVGIRTQTIQLLRDGMYRLCEAYMSDALDQRSYNRLQRRYQNLMMGLLSIEQLSGAIVAPQIAIASSATASQRGAGELVRNQMAQTYSDAKVKVAEALQTVNATQKEQGAAEVAVNSAKAESPIDQGKLKAAEGVLTKLKEKSVESTKAYDLAVAREAVYKEGFEKSLNGIDTTAAGGSIHVFQNSPPKGDNDFSKMAETVRDIVETVINKALVTDECFLTVSEVANSSDAKSAADIAAITAAVTNGMNVCSKLGSDQVLQKLQADALSAKADLQRMEIENLRKQLGDAKADIAKFQALEQKFNSAKEEFAKTIDEIKSVAEASAKNVTEATKATPSTVIAPPEN